MTLTNSHLRASLVKTLSDGQFYSGEQLAQQYGLSRTAIANNLSALAELGLDIYSVKGKGYALSKPLQLLDEVNIREHLAAPHAAPITLFPVIDSTNNYIKDNIGDMEHGEVVIAETQTAGRGRRGKTWISPFGASLYLSLCWRFQGGYQQIGGLSLYVGYAVVKALEALNVEGLGLKWPNDIYRHGKKLGGILVEVDGQIGTEVSCIIGVGINVNLPDVQSQIEQPFTDLNDHQLCRNKLCAAVIDSLNQGLPDFEENGLATILEQWNQWDVFANQTVHIIQGNNTQRGVNLGIDASGALKLQMPEGVKTIHGGEVSLRAE